MFARLKRIVRSFIGMFIEMAEDPEMILKQNMRDMQDQVPQMNQNIAMVKSSCTLLEREAQKLGDQERELTAKIQAALKAGRRDIALNFATTLEQVKRDKISTEGQLELASQAYEKAQKVKAMFIREKERKTKEAMAAIRAKKRSEWQAKVADAMESFTVAGIDSTHDEMVDRIEEQAAQKSARLEVALDNVDHQAYQIEEDAKKLQANDTLRQFELQMGLISEEPALSEPVSEKTFGPAETEKIS